MDLGGIISLQLLLDLLLLECQISILIFRGWLLTHNVQEVLLVNVLGKIVWWVLLIKLLLSLLVWIVEALNVVGFWLHIRLLLQLLLHCSLLLLEGVLLQLLQLLLDDSRLLV